jgi:hypothetical protein
MDLISNTIRKFHIFLGVMSDKDVIKKEIYTFNSSAH